MKIAVTSKGTELTSEVDEINRIKKFIRDLKADELKAEIDFLYPKGNNVIRGTIDLLAFYGDRIEIIDYKTDKSRKYENIYKVQLEIYRDVIKEIYKDKSFKEKEDFVFESPKYRLKMVFSHGPHCKELVICDIKRPSSPLLIVKDLAKVRDLFYLGRFEVNFRCMHENQ